MNRYRMLCRVVCRGGGEGGWSGCEVVCREAIGEQRPSNGSRGNEP